MALATVGLAQFPAHAGPAAAAGDLIDRFSRKPILAASWAGRARCLALLWWLAGHGAAGVDGITRCWCCSALARVRRAPSSRLLPQIVPRGRLRAGGGGQQDDHARRYQRAVPRRTRWAARLAYAVCGLLRAEHACWWRWTTRPIRPRWAACSSASGRAYASSTHHPGNHLAGPVRGAARRRGGACCPSTRRRCFTLSPAGAWALRSAAIGGNWARATSHLSMRPFDHRVGMRCSPPWRCSGWPTSVFSLSHGVRAVVRGADGGGRGGHGQRLHPRARWCSSPRPTRCAGA